MFINKINKFFLPILIVLIIFLSFFPRAVEVLNGNPVFGFDQGREMLAAKNIVVNHKLILIGTELGAGSAGVSGIFQGPIYYYLLTIPFFISNGNPAGATWLMLLFGLFSIVFGYYLGKKIFNKYVGILTALLMSISPPLIAQSRFIWSPNLPTLFILLSFYFTYLFAINKKNIFVFLAAFFAGFTYNFEMAIAVPLVFALFIYSIYTLKKEFNKYLYLIFGFLFAFSPMIFFEIRHGFMGLKGLIYYLFYHPQKTTSFNVNFMFEHFQSFFNNFKDTFPINNLPFSILFFTIFIILIILFTKREKDRKIKNFIQYLTLLAPVSFLVFIFLKNTVWSYYLTDLNLSYILIFVYIVYKLIERRNFNLNIIVFCFLTILIIFGIYSGIKTSLYDLSDYGGTAKLKGKVDAIDYIYKDAENKPFGLLVFSPPVYIYPYDYIIWWYGQNKYHFAPYKTKKGTFYLLIETDPDKPWSYKGWLQTVIKTGRIEWTRTLSSGFIIQKRIN